MYNFRNLIRSPQQMPPAGSSRDVGLPPSAMAEFETRAADPSAVAAKIVRAAATRDAGGLMMAKMSDTAAAIIKAGRKRRGEQ